MSTRFWLSFLLGISVATATSVTHAEGNPRAGTEKAAVCAGCHGPKGTSTNPRYPNLAGQHERYLIESLTAYREGARKDPVMAPMAENLSDSDIRDLAAFYASQECE